MKTMSKEDRDMVRVYVVDGKELPVGTFFQQKKIVQKRFTELHQILLPLCTDIVLEETSVSMSARSAVLRFHLHCQENVLVKLEKEGFSWHILEDLEVTC